MGENLAGINGAGNGSPQGDAYKSGKRNNMPSGLEYQYTTNNQANNVGSSGISKGGGFFPTLRNKGGPSQPRESNLA